MQTFKHSSKLSNLDDSSLVLTSLGWESAFSSGFSIAKDAAVGDIAFAQQVNNEMAYNLSNLNYFSNTYEWALVVIAVMVIVPAVLYMQSVKHKIKVDE